jgi:hypothetical protein
MAGPRLRALVLAAALAVTGCTGGPGATVAPTVKLPVGFSPPPLPTLLWPAPANPMDLSRAAGLVPETEEKLAYHVHAHLDIFLDGAPIMVAPGIGINIKDPKVKTFPESDGSTSYGGITEACAEACISPLHTHGSYGILHTESATPVPNTLGQLFIEWDLKLSATCVAEHCSPAKAVAFYVNGEAYTGDPAAIELADRTEIAIVIGTPPETIPATGIFDGT